MLNLLQLKCPNCDAKHSIGPAIRSFECSCGKKLRVPQKQGKAAKGSSRQRAPQPPASVAVKPIASKAPVRASKAPVRVKPAPQADLDKATAKEQNGEQEKLAPFVLKPRTEPVSQENWLFEDAPTFGFARLIWEDIKFFTRLAIPYCVIIGLVVAAIVYRVELKSKVSEIHAMLVQRMRPAPEKMEMPVDDAVGIMENLERDVAEEITASNDHVEISIVAATRAIQANVILSIPGQGDGSGVVCGIVGTDALILTNRSSVDQMFLLTAGDQVSDEFPSVNVAYANNTKSVGEVIWVADGKIDLAIIKAECLGRIQPVNWRSNNSAAEGDRVFYVDPSQTNTEMVQTEITQVVKEPTAGVPVVKVNVSTRKVPMGAGLYSENGELVAISGQGSLAGMSNAIQVSVLETLQPAALLNQ